MTMHSMPREEPCKKQSKKPTMPGWVNALSNSASWAAWFRDVVCAFDGVRQNLMVFASSPSPQPLQDQR